MLSRQDEIADAVYAGRKADRTMAFKHIIGYTSQRKRLGLVRCHEEVLRQFGNAHQVSPWLLSHSGSARRSSRHGQSFSSCILVNYLKEVAYQTLGWCCETLLAPLLSDNGKCPNPRLQEARV